MEGKVTFISESYLIIEINRHAYKVQIPSNKGYEVDKTTKVFIQKFIKLFNSSNISIEEYYGFIEEEEREIFNDLLLIRGIGVKTALSVLKNGWKGIHDSICEEDVNKFENITGLKKNFADFVFLELKNLCLARFLKKIDKITIRQLKQLGFEDIKIFKELNNHLDINKLTMENIIERISRK